MFLYCLSDSMAALIAPWGQIVLKFKLRCVYYSSHHLSQILGLIAFFGGNCFKNILEWPTSF